MRGRSTGWMLAAAAALGPTACNDSPDDPLPAGANARVVEVVDGDTIDVEIGGRTERVRLIGIDTPEVERPDAPGECYGPEATAFAASLLPPGTAVRMERDVVGRDDYGRLLAYVHTIADDADPADSAAAAALADALPADTFGVDRFVNVTIVRRGYARPLTIEPNVAYAEEFVAAARDAERDDLGLWAACDE